MFRILLTHTPDALALQFNDGPQKAVAELGELVFNPGGVLEGAALIEAALGCDIVIADRKTAFPAAFFRAVPDVKAVLRCAVDIRNIDVDAASTAGILVTRSIPAFGPSVAELALGMMIDGARRISRCVQAYANGNDPQIAMGRQLKGDTLGIVGFGVIGHDLALLGRALGMRVLVATPRPIPEIDGIEAVSMDRLLAESGYVVCLARASAETTGMFGTNAFAAMRNDAMFLNLARGELVDEAALEAALDHGEIACAAMDVGSAPDQRPDPRLAARPDVIATPHIGGQTPDAIEGQALHVAKQIAALAGGQCPPDAINASAATRLSGLVDLEGK